jgi:hypothetical protein
MIELPGDDVKLCCTEYQQKPIEGADFGLSPKNTVTDGTVPGRVVS